MDKSVYRNLDTQHRLLANLERVVANELAADPEAEQVVKERHVEVCPQYVRAYP
jgi:hypothetical protein